MRKQTPYFPVAVILVTLNWTHKRSIFMSLSSKYFLGLSFKFHDNIDKKNTMLH